MWWIAIQEEAAIIKLIKKDTELIGRFKTDMTMAKSKAKTPQGKATVILMM